MPKTLKDNFQLLKIDDFVQVSKQLILFRILDTHLYLSRSVFCDELEKINQDKEKYKYLLYFTCTAQT